MDKIVPKEGLHNTTAISLLHPDEPRGCTIVNGTSPLIIAGPHNGHLVPQSLYEENRPLGLHSSCFDPGSPFKRHEACDWGVAGLFESLQEQESAADQSHSYISATYSRLACDLNRTVEHCITEKSCETGNVVPGNTDIDEVDEAMRLTELYAPYHQQIKNLIDDTRARLGYAIFLDLHSFAPTWKGEKRAVHISTTACSDHFIESFISQHMSEACASRNLRFAAHEPFDLKAVPKLGATAHSVEKTGTWYTGLEIRNDLLDTPKSTEKIAGLIHEIAATLTDHHDKMAFIKASDIKESESFASV